MKRKLLIILVPAAVLLLAGGALFLNGTHSKTDTAAVPEITTVEAKEGMVSVTVDTAAIAEPSISRTFRALSGGTIMEIAEEGSHRKEGDLLIAFNVEELDRAVSLAEISLRESALSLEKAEAALSRALKLLSDREVLHASGAVSRELVEAAREGADSARYALRSAELSLEKSRLNLAAAREHRKNGIIRAPFDGTVLKAHFSPGDWAGQNSILLEYGDLSRLSFRGEIDEYDIGMIETGMQVSIIADSMGGMVLQARVERISPQAQIVNNIAVFTVTAAADNPELRMKPGMSADMTVMIAGDSGIVVPSRAVSTVRTRSYLDVLADEEIETRRVTVGADDGINIVITEGLEAGEMVVLPAQAGILPGLTPSAPAPTNGNSIIPMPIPGSSGGGAPPSGGSGGGAGSGGGR